MTNNTQLKPCPFCGSDALHYDNGYATCGKYRCPMNGVVVKNENWNARAAPAEDVRAVVEEPVAWTSVNTLGFLDQRRSEARTAWRLNLSTHPLQSDDIALYRHPQRPVVLPERKQNIHQGLSHTDARSAGWNACLDAVEELNK